MPNSDENWEWSDRVSIISFKRQITGIKKNLLILFFYAIITIFLTYPVIIKTGDFVPGYLDVFNSMYVLWHTHLAVFTNQTSLSYNYLLFWPEGIPRMAFGSAYNQILAIILLSFLSLPTTYTLLWISTFIIGAFGTYLLVEYLTHNHIAAFIAGLAFAFSPYHFAHAQGHLGATTIQWIPFCTLFLMMMYQEKELKYSVLAGIFFILVGMSDLQYLVFMGLFVALLFLFEMWIHGIRDCPDFLDNFQKILKKYLLFGFVATIGILPFVIGDIIVATSATNYLKPDTLEATLYSADILSFFIPSSLHTVFGAITSPVYQNFSGNVWENTQFIGYTILFLSLCTVWKFRQQALVKFWLISAILFSLFSLGPVLHINGKTVFPIFDIPTTIPLPYMLLSRIVPFLENSRTPGRFFVIATLAFAVLAGYGIDKMLSSGNKQKKLLSVLFCVLIIFEFLCVPYVMSPLDQPAFYKKISSDKDTYALLEIPASQNYSAFDKIEYYQTIHGKPIVGGYAGRMPANARDFEKNTPFIRELTFSEKSQNDIINQSVFSIGNSVLRYYNIRYIVLHKDSMTNEQLENALSLLDQCDPILPKVYEDNVMVVYAQNRTEVGSHTIILGSGWHELENWTGIPTRWMSDNASIRVKSDTEKDTLLNFTAITFVKKRPVLIMVNNKTVGSFQIAPGFINESVPVRINKGMNSFEFISPDGCERPVDTPSNDNPDTRCISIALQNISIQ